MGGGSRVGREREIGREGGTCTCIGREGGGGWGREEHEENRERASE